MYMQEKNYNENENQILKELRIEQKKNEELIFGKKTPQEIAEKKELDRLEELNNLKMSFRKDKKDGIDAIAKYLVEKYHFKTICGQKNDELYIYKDGIYILDLGRKIIKQELERILEELCTTHYVNEVIEKIKRQTFVEINKDDFHNKNYHLLCLQNGILDIKNKELKKHNEDILFLSKIPVNYNQNADCPNVKQFFKDVLYPEDIAVAQEWLGFCLYRDYFIKKAIILVGEAHGGKTTMLNLLTRFIGSENICGESLQRLAKDRFASASLHGKLSNIYDDLTFEDISSGGAFKMATGSSRLTAEHKFGDRFHFISFAKLTFAANKIPSIKDTDDDAYFGRWIVIRFDNAFDENNPKRDINILQKITTDEELSGLLNWALIGLDRLLENGRFGYDKSPENVKLIMQRSSSSLAAFTQDMLGEKLGGWLSKQQLYEAYSLYTRKQSISKLTIEKVGRNIPKIINYITEQKKNNLRGWGNVTLKSDNDIICL